MGPRVGVLALQGAFEAHAPRLRVARALTSSRSALPADLDGLDALAMPGGESTTMSRLLVTSGLFDDLKVPHRRRAAGVRHLRRHDPARHARCSTDDPTSCSFGAIDLTVRRNGYGRQLDSFEADLDVDGLDDPVPRRLHPGPVGRGGRRRRSKRSPSMRVGSCSPARATSPLLRSIPSSPMIIGCTRCSSQEV